MQAAFEAALSRVANQPIQVVGAGRADSGVHATWQIIHFDSQAERSERSWMRGANANLPDDARLLWARIADDDFHARFSAQERSYRYVILNREVRSALLHRQVTWQYKPLDESRMQEGVRYLLGEHDFSSFRALACQAHSPVRTIHRLDVTRSGKYLYLDIVANAFLHHMVRNIAGVLMAVGCGEQEPGWVRDILDQRDRTQGGVTAPADGLYLVGVRYPERYGIESVGFVPEFG